MSGALLFLRARRSGVSCILLLGLGVLQRPIGRAEIRLGGDQDAAVPWAVVVPVLSGAIIGLFAASAMTDWESGAARSMIQRRAAHLAALLTVAAVASVWGTASLKGAITTEAALRNTAGFAGLALLTATAVGAAAAWTVPVALAILCLVSGVYEGHAASWAWPIQPDGNLAAGIAASVLLLLGMASATLRGTREPRHEHF